MAATAGLQPRISKSSCTKVDASQTYLLARQNWQMTRESPLERTEVLILILKLICFLGCQSLRPADLIDPGNQAAAKPCAQGPCGVTQGLGRGPCYERSTTGKEQNSGGPQGQWVAVVWCFHTARQRALNVRGVDHSC